MKITGDEGINKAIEYLFVDGKNSRFPVVIYEHIMKCVADVKNQHLQM